MAKTKIKRRVRFTLEEEDVPAFMGYLGLGVLTAMRNRTVSADVGIWTLGRPISWEFAIRYKLNVPEGIMLGFQVADEFDAAWTLGVLQKNIDEYIQKIEKDLSTMPNPEWVYQPAVEVRKQASPLIKGKHRRYHPNRKSKYRIAREPLVKLKKRVKGNNDDD